MNTIYHQPVGDLRPKRGDLVQSVRGTKRERTWLILSTHNLPTRWCPEMDIEAQRTRVHAARWWELEVPIRLALARSAERAGGQLCHTFVRFPPKRKQTFEDYMRAGTASRKQPCPAGRSEQL